MSYLTGPAMDEGRKQVQENENEKVNCCRSVLDMPVPG